MHSTSPHNAALATTRFWADVWCGRTVYPILRPHSDPKCSHTLVLAVGPDLPETTFGFEPWEGKHSEATVSTGRTSPLPTAVTVAWPGAAGDRSGPTNPKLSPCHPSVWVGVGRYWTVPLGAAGSTARHWAFVWCGRTSGVTGLGSFRLVSSRRCRG